MRNYSSRQYMFAKYLLNKIGITDPDFIDSYLYYYAEKYGYYERIFPGTDLHFNVSQSITELLDEKNLRSNRNSITLKYEKNTRLNATDIANFTFCPVNFSINHSFIVEKPVAEVARLIGTEFHEELRLMKKSGQQRDDSYYNKFDDDALIKILNSTLIYLGHDEQQTESGFFNKEKNIACNPDYIFQDDLGDFFVVEEKFHYYKRPRYFLEDEIEQCEKRKKIFHINHIMQVLAYLDSITKYHLKYAYLVYWYFDFSQNKPYVHDVSIKKIHFDEYYAKLYSKTINALHQFINDKKMIFLNNKLNPRKCAGCVVTKYCGHKSQKYFDLELPYRLEDLQLFQVEFPEELRKQ